MPMVIPWMVVVGRSPYLLLLEGPEPMFAYLLSRENHCVRRPALVLYLIVWGPLFLMEPILGSLELTYRCLRENRNVFRQRIRNWSSHYSRCIRKVWREGV